MPHARFLSDHAARDADLVRSARAGDIASLGILLDRYRPRLLGSAMSIVGHRPEAEDAVHDTFLTALAHLDELNDPAAVGGWLHATLRNRCLMHLRSKQRRAEVRCDDVVLEAIPDESRVENRLESGQLRDWVWHALGRLPESIRTTMLLRHFGSFESYEEIAALLGVPVGTVRSRLFDGRARLANLLLDAAGVGAADQRALEEERRAFFFESLRELFEQRRCDDYFEVHAENLEMTWSGKRITRGRHHLQKEIEGDFDDGVVMTPQRILACGNVTILEGLFLNPPHAQSHCPPGLALVMFHEGSQVTRMHLHLSPRPPQADDASL